ncbi:hypothetical protein ABZ345_17595 [Lentzea sp. NPDC005914]|uniref:hypothetical protein n=1 Tax=Lentzea sp. NPDC005914 TaxID=3154572 RepID=UPI0033C29BAF
MRSVVIALLLACSGSVLAGCGTGATGQPARSSTETVPPHTPEVVEGGPGTLNVKVDEPADRATAFVRYLRIEDARGKNVLERSYRSAPAGLSEHLGAGNYRVVTWIRPCGGACEGKKDDQLGVPERICGTKADVADAAVTEIVVKAPPDADCVAEIG